MIISKLAFLYNTYKVFDDEEYIITPVIPEDFLGWATLIAADANFSSVGHTDPSLTCQTIYPTKKCCN